MKHETKTPLREDPVRLRQCLTALSEACGHDVFRFEVLRQKSGWRFIITASKQTREEDIALLIAAKLRELFNKIDIDTSEIEREPKG